MFYPTNVRTYNVKQLNKSVVSKLEKHPDIIELLDYWVLLPDGNIANQLEVYAPIIRKIQSPILPPLLYRGFSTSGYQNTMGLVDNGFFSNSLKKNLAGKWIEFSLTHPLSFTTNRELAKGFGENTVIVKSVDIVEHCIWISPEICYLIALRRNLKSYETNDEVIVLPSAKRISISLLSTDPPSKKW